MKTITFLTFLLFSITYGQKINYDIHNTSLKQYFELEKKSNSEELEQPSKNFMPNNEIDAIQFITKEKSIPDLITTYTFKKSDSTILEIEHEWDVYNFEKQDNNKKSPEFESEMIEKYKSLKTDATKIFGPPIVKRNYSNISMRDSINTFIESSKWHPNEETEIELYATISNYYEKAEFTTINPVHRIRLYIRNTKKEENSEEKLSKDKIASLDKVFKKYYGLLQDGKITESKELLSNLIKDDTTNEMLQGLIENLNLSSDIELYLVGKDIMPDGRIFIGLQYKYSNDFSDTPQELIKVLFDEKDKIVGINPLTKSNK